MHAYYFVPWMRASIEQDVDTNGVAD